MTIPCSDRRDVTIEKIGVVADDLTGACDSGVEFLSCATEVLVVVQPDADSLAGAGEAIMVYNTQSRNLPPAQAYEGVLQATRRALSTGASLILKKVDSALRGNVGAEIDAVMDATNAAIALILPAIPDARRKTVGGVQHIDGVPVAETFYAADPEHPVTESSVLRRVEEGSARKAGLISLSDVRAGKTAETVAKVQKQGSQLIVVDAESARDLDIAVRDLLRVRQPRVFVGCQGLAAALNAHLPCSPQSPSDFECPEGPLLFLCGTPHPRTKRQLQVAGDSGSILLVEVTTDRLAAHTRNRTLLKELEASCRKGLREGKSVALFVSGVPTASSPGSCESVLQFLSDLSRGVVEETRPGALLLSGGETAFAVCRALGVQVVKLHAQPAPLVVTSKVVGGPCHGMILITKGGSIGPDDLLCNIDNWLRTRQ